MDERDGQMYSFMSRSEMECDIKSGRFLEHGEYDGNLYGTKINSIHEVMETSKICILDVNPQVGHLVSETLRTLLCIRDEKLFVAQTSSTVHVININLKSSKRRRSLSMLD